MINWHRIRSVLAIALFVAPAAIAVPAAEVDGFGPGESAARWIALPLDEASRALVAPYVTRTEPATGEVLLTSPPTVPAEAAAKWAADLRAAGRFSYITPDEYCLPQDLPGDPLFGDQWHLQRLKLPQAWELSSGLPSVKVAVIDTGIDLTHPELLSRRVLGASCIGGIVWQADLQDPIIDDLSGHGTEVSGVLAAETDNQLGIASVGRNIRVLPIKASQDIAGGAFLSDILRGARAGADAGAVAVSVSYSGLTSPAVATTGQYVANAGSLLFWAAGNNGATLGTEVDWPNVIIVGATDTSDALAVFSARGPAVDLVAPGVAILTTSRGGQYTVARGTSYAAPIAAAVAGLMKSADMSLTALQIDSILRSTAADRGATGPDELFGSGRVDALAAVAAAAGRTEPVVLPDRAVALAGEFTRVGVLGNDADPLGRPLRIVLTDVLPASVGTASVVEGVTTGLDAIGVQIRPDSPLGEVALRYAVLYPGEPEGGVTGTLVLKIDDPTQYAASTAVTKVVAGLDATYYQLDSAPTAMPEVSALDGLREAATVLDIEGSEAPAGPLLAANNFAAVYRGFVRIPATGEYTLSLWGDDGASLVLGGGASALVARSTAFVPAAVSVRLRSGLHSLRVEHYHADGPWGLRLVVGPAGWSATSTSGSWFFRQRLVADIAGPGGAAIPDEVIDVEDFLAFINAFSLAENVADIAGGGGGFEPDGTVDGTDFIEFINAFASGY